MTAKVYKTICSKLLQVDITKPLDLCCLCLDVAGEDSTSVEDEVFISVSTGTLPVALKISNILKMLINENFSEELYVLRSVCKQCLNSAIAAYKFIEQCKINMDILYEVVDNLEDGLNNITDEMESYKTVYVAINPQEVSKKSVITRYFDTYRQFIPQDTGLLRFQMILENVHPRVSLCSKMTIDTKDILYDPEKPYEYRCIICQEIFLNGTCLRIHFFRKHHHSRDVKCKECEKFTYLHPEDDILEDNELENVEFNEEHIIDTDLQHSVDIQQHQDTPIDDSEDILLSNVAAEQEIIKESTECTEQIFTCFACNSTFKDLSKFKKHKETKKTCRSKGNYVCDICKRCYGYKNLLANHIHQAHMSQRGHLCEVCGKNFRVRVLLIRHMRSHTKEKPYICVQCGNKYASAQYLRVHMADHREEEPFKCDFCDMAFKNTIRLSQHIINKHKPRTHECKICHKMFSTNYNMKQHLKTHFRLTTLKVQKEKIKQTYICQYCSKEFKTKAILMDHVSRHLAPTLQCDICFKMFKAKSDVGKHKRKHFNKNSKLYIERL